MRLPRLHRPESRAALAMLQAVGASVVPRSICNGGTLWALANDGLVEKTEIPGVWTVTEAGRQVNVDHWDANKSRSDIDLLMDTYDTASDPREGDIVFGHVVTNEEVKYLARRPPHHRFIFFAYQAGFSLRLIANTIWRKGAVRVPWVSEDVTQVRALRLNLPRRTEVATANPAADALRVRLINEGCTDEEVDEYFSGRRGER